MSSRDPRGSGSRRPLQTFVVSYSAVAARAGRVIHRPMLPVRLSWRGKPHEDLMIVDSGADSSVIPTEVAERLGLELEGPVLPIRGVGSLFEARVSTVYLQIAAEDTHGRTGIPKLLERVLVPVTKGVVTDPILGREPFLEGFELTLRQAKHEFVLRELGQ